MASGSSERRANRTFNFSSAAAVSILNAEQVIVMRALHSEHFASSGMLRSSAISVSSGNSQSHHPRSAVTSWRGLSTPVSTTPRTLWLNARDRAGKVAKGRAGDLRVNGRAFKLVDVVAGKNDGSSMLLNGLMM